MDGMEKDLGNTVRIGMLSNFATTFFAVATTVVGQRTRVTTYRLDIASPTDDLTGPRSFTPLGFVHLVTTIRQFVLHGTCR